MCWFLEWNSKHSVAKVYNKKHSKPQNFENKIQWMGFVFWERQQNRLLCAKYWPILMFHQENKKNRPFICVRFAFWFTTFAPKMWYPFNSLVLTRVFQKWILLSTELKWRYHMAVIRIACFFFFSLLSVRHLHFHSKFVAANKWA